MSIETPDHVFDVASAQAHAVIIDVVNEQQEKAITSAITTAYPLALAEGHRLAAQLASTLPTNATVTDVVAVLKQRAADLRSEALAVLRPAAVEAAANTSTEAM